MNKCWLLRVQITVTGDTETWQRVELDIPMDGINDVSVIVIRVDSSRADETFELRDLYIKACCIERNLLRTVFFLHSN